jgi:hypothetical protein
MRRVVGALAARFGPSRERTREGGAWLGTPRGGEGKVRWCMCLSEGDRWPAAHGDDEGERRSGEAHRGGVRYGGAWATPRECGLATGEGRWAGPKETVPGGGSKLIRF